MLSMCWAEAQALPLARRGSATLVAKKAASASGVIGATRLRKLRKARPEIGNDRSGAEPPGHIGKHGVGIGEL